MHMIQTRLFIHIQNKIVLDVDVMFWTKSERCRNKEEESEAQPK